MDVKAEKMRAISEAAPTPKPKDLEYWMDETKDRMTESAQIGDTSCSLYFIPDEFMHRVIIHLLQLGYTFSYRAETNFIPEDWTVEW